MADNIPSAIKSNLDIHNHGEQPKDQTIPTMDFLGLLTPTENKATDWRVPCKTSGFLTTSIQNNQTSK
jgi:hypothetical protein